MSYDKSAFTQQQHHAKRVIKKRVKDWNNYPHASAPVKQSNKWNKRNAFNCGNARCWLCCNPRRTYGHLTLAETSANESFRYALQHIE